MIGRQVSHYRIVSKVGGGGMGVVYRAEDTRLGRHVAVKFLPPQALSVPEAVERFRREARIISSLNHPHICTLHDVGDVDGQQFMVMELLEGESIKDRIAAGPLPIDDALALVGQMADALDVAHSAGIVHRDIKPANLFVVEHGGAKVLDFGVAKLTQPDASASREPDETSAPTVEVSSVGSAVGTIAYMSPEQARGELIDGRSDLFSLGAVLYELLTGVRAFQGVTPAVVFEGILTKEPPAPSTLRPDVPPELDDVVSKALAKLPADRYQTAADLRADLTRVRRATEGGAAGSITAWTPRRWGAMLVGGPLVMVIVVFAILLWQSQRTPALTERDTVILADFQNRTGDEVFDGTLSEALAVQIRQSPFLHLLPEQEVLSTLRLMGRQTGDAITMDVAREICQRQHAKAVLGGTIASVGATYVLTLRAQNCLDGDVIAESQREAGSKESVIRALSAAASDFRSNLGESISTVQRYEQDIEAVTTSSLEALKAYSQGMAARRRFGDQAAVPFLERAVQLDPDFAFAHGRLGTVLGNLGRLPEAERSATRAYELRSRVTERERYYLDARYHTVKREYAKAIETYKLLIAAYPDDYVGHSNLGSLYRNEGMLKEAVASMEEAVRLAPTQPLSVINLAFAYIEHGDFRAARKTAEGALRLSESLTARNALLIIAALTGDQALEDEQVAALADRAADPESLGVRILIAQLKGSMAKASRLTDTLFRSLQTSGKLQVGAEGLLGIAINDALSGRLDVARAAYARLNSSIRIPDVAADEVAVLGIVLSDRPLSQRHADRALKYQASLPPSASASGAATSTRALSAFNEGRFPEAYALASSVARPFETATAYVAGLSAMKMKRWDAAVEAFSQITERGKRQLMPPVAPVWVMIGRTHHNAGRAADARKAYEEAFKVWKVADADLPILIEARREYGSLPR